MKLGNYEVEWQYYANPHYERPYVLTKCRIFQRLEKILIHESNALCQLSSDRFIKEFGRKLSLTRAIRTLSKQERTQIWKDYFNRKKNEKV